MPNVDSKQPKQFTLDKPFCYISATDLMPAGHGKHKRQPHTFVHERRARFPLVTLYNEQHKKFFSQWCAYVSFPVALVCGSWILDVSSLQRSCATIWLWNVLRASLVGYQNLPCQNVVMLKKFGTFSSNKKGISSSKLANVLVKKRLVYPHFGMP